MLDVPEQNRNVRVHDSTWHWWQAQKHGQMNAGESEQKRAFPSTHWSQIYLASHRERADGARALGELLQTYRPAIEAHVKRRSGDSGQIAEWVDAFIEKRILEGDLLRQAKQSKGRFRGFLFKSIDRFVTDQIRRDNRKCRRPSGGIVPLDDLLEHHTPAIRNNQPDPGDRAWAIRVVDLAKEHTEAFYRRKERPETWEIFMHGFYLPLRSGAVRHNDAELASRFGFSSPAQVSNTITTVKRKFGNCVRQIVAKYVPATADIDAEIRELMAILADGSAD